MIIPNLFLVGAPKCGTTAMHSYLSQHPDIFMASKKELHFFGRDLKSDSFTKNYADYLSNFKSCAAEKVVGEASVWYLSSVTAAREIKQFSPSAKILIMLRNPVEMIYSNYYQMLYNGNESVKPFKAALELERERRRGHKIPGSTHFVKSLYYSETGKYYKQVKRYLEVFGRENVLVIFYDDFKNKTAEVYKNTLQFLGVEDSFRAEFSIINSNKIIKNDFINKVMLQKGVAGSIAGILGKTLVPPFIRKRIKDYVRKNNVEYSSRPELDSDTFMYLMPHLEKDIDLLSDLLNKDLSKWKQYNNIVSQ